MNDAIKEVGLMLSDLRLGQLQAEEGKHKHSLMTTVCSHVDANIMI